MRPGLGGYETKDNQPLGLPYIRIPSQRGAPCDLFRRDAGGCLLLESDPLPAVGSVIRSE